MEKMLMNTLMGRKDINRKVDKVGSLTEPLTQSMKDTIDSSSLKESLLPESSNNSTIITKDSIDTEQKLNWYAFVCTFFIFIVFIDFKTKLICSVFQFWY